MLHHEDIKVGDVIFEKDFGPDWWLLLIFKEEHGYFTYRVLDARHKNSIGKIWKTALFPNTKRIQ